MTQSNSAPRFAGRVVTLGGTDYTVPPLNVGALKALAPQLEATANLTGMPTLTQWDDVLDVFLAAFRRNYPDMTREQLEELVDMGNFLTLSNVVFGGSGLLKGEERPGIASAESA
jgi:hypothetical protein